MLDLSIIIPFKNQSSLTIKCLESLNKFGNPVKEIILISNNSNKAELALIKDTASKFDNVIVLKYNHSFNFQKINNWAAKKSTSKTLLFLNNDIEFTNKSKKILQKMYDLALKPNIGAVGSVLLYEDNITIQHAGVFLIPGGTADHLYIRKKFKQVLKNIEDKKLEYDIRKNLKVSAVTAACVMVEKSKFNKIKGFNEDFIICGGDVDLCLRLEESGYNSVLAGCSSGTIIHKESKSRSLIAVPYIDFVESYKSYIKHFDYSLGDPYLNWEKVNK